MESDETRDLCVQSVLETIIAVVCLGNQVGGESPDARRERIETAEYNNQQQQLQANNHRDKKPRPQREPSPAPQCNVVPFDQDQQEDDDAISIEKSQITIRNLLLSLNTGDDDDDDDEFGLQSSCNSSQSTFGSIFDQSCNGTKKFYSHDTLTGWSDADYSKHHQQHKHTVMEPFGYEIGTFPRKERRNTVKPKRDVEILDPRKSSSMTSMSTLFKEFSINQIHLTIPHEIKEIPIDLLHSNVAITPGTRDRKGHQVLIIRIDEMIWEKCDVDRNLLARYLLYLTCRMTSFFLVLIDARSSHVASSSDTAIESLGLLQEYGKGVATQFEVLFLTDDNLHADNLKSYIEGRLRTKCDVIKSMEELDMYVARGELPQELGGSRSFSQAEWVQGRLVVDSYVVFCENICQRFNQRTIEISSQPTPANVRDTKRVLANHRDEVRTMMDDSQLRNLRNRGQRVLEHISQCGSHDEIMNADIVQKNFDEASKAIAQFITIADERLIVLERHLLVMKFEQSCDYISRWYEENMPMIEKKFASPAESFDALRLQMKEFDVFYIQVTRQYSKCKGLLSEANEYKDLGYIVDGELVQRARTTEEQISRLMLVMDDRKREVEAASDMYRFIDQAYSWALNGMKFVVMLSVDECVSIEKCQEMIAKFDNYMDQHPAINEASFKEIFTLARHYGNRNCIRQCEFAEQKCRETLDLFKKRRELLMKAKSQLTKAKKRSLSTSYRMRNRDSLDTKNNKFSSPGGGHMDGMTTRIVSSPQSTNGSHLESGRRRISLQSVESKTSSTSDEVSSCGDVGSVRSGRSRDGSAVLHKSQSMRLSRKQQTMNRSLSTGTGVHKRVTRSNSSLTAAATVSCVIPPTGSPQSVPNSELDKEDSENEAKVNMTIDELISTEREYVKSLNYVIEHYVPEMTRLDLPHALRCKRNVIFGNMEKIAEFHSNRFLRELEHCRGNPQAVAHAFQLHKDSFSLYALYSKNKPQSDLLLAEHGNEFFMTKQMQLKDKMNLASYLLKPVQRMAKYALLLYNMAKKSHGTAERFLKEAESLVKFQLRHGNDLLTMDSIRDCDVNLKEQGNLLRQEHFTMYSGRKKLTRRLFLFEDLILFAKPVSVPGGHDAYQYKCSYKTAEIGMTENIGDSGTKFEIWFRRRKSHATQDRFVVQSHSHSSKRAWVDEIRSLLWKQALRNKDHRKLEMTSMGIGNKPHIDIAPSTGNSIVDRSVHSNSLDLLLNDRISHSRSRASIALGGSSSSNVKRPHSIVSTTSNTSSANSSMVSSLSLASWPSKGADRRYATLPSMASSTSSHLPMAYRDFHAIAEVEDEGIPESIGSSSLCTTPGQCATNPSDDAERDDGTNGGADRRDVTGGGSSSDDAIDDGVSDVTTCDVMSCDDVIKIKENNNNHNVMMTTAATASPATTNCHGDIVVIAETVMTMQIGDDETPTTHPATNNNNTTTVSSQPPTTATTTATEDSAMDKETPTNRMTTV